MNSSLCYRVEEPHLSLHLRRSPALNENLPRRTRTKSTMVHSRFGDDEMCGFQSYVAKIRGGDIANIDEFPWMAMLLYEMSECDGPLSGVMDCLD